MNLPETIEQSDSTNVDQGAHCNLVSAEVDFEVADRIRDLIVPAAKESFLDAIQLVDYSLASQQKSTASVTIYVSFS